MNDTTLERTLLDLEERMWEANRNGDAGYFQAHLADDAIAVASFGVFDKGQAVVQAAENRVPFTRTRLEGARVLQLGEAGALVTYRAFIAAVRDGAPFSFSIYATSAWRRVGDGWEAVLHQWTPVEKTDTGA
jgi:ketosteroid isomerase-like protein